MRGIFPVLQTAVNDDDGLDVVSLRKQADFCIQAGAHGLGDADSSPSEKYFWETASASYQWLDR